MVWAAFSALMRNQDMDRWQRVGFRRGLAGRQPGLKLIAQTGQFLQIRGMRKRPPRRAS